MTNHGFVKKEGDLHVSTSSKYALQNACSIANYGFIKKEGDLPSSTSSKYAFQNVDDLRPFLDAIDRLRAMSLAEEGITLPTIVVVGDQSHGKSSVLESLAGVDLPRGTGIVTRVPLVLRLQDSKDVDVTKVVIQYGGEEHEIDEDDIMSAVEVATEKLAGNGKDIVNNPIALHIKKPNAPDLTMVDLPGITRVPVHGQPEDILEQITSMILEYIKPEDSIILNVVQASVDFSTCESIRLSRRVDEGGDRTLVVVTKVDKSPENLFEKVSAAAASIGLGYICVRNKTDREDSYEEARSVEAKLFTTHPELKKFPKEMVGIPSLAKQLMEIQRQSIRKSLPRMVTRIEADVSSKRRELNRMPQKADDVKSASSTYLRIARALRKCMENLMSGNFTDYPSEKLMHMSARCYEMCRDFSSAMLASGKWDNIEALLTESQGVNLPNFLEASVFQQLISDCVGNVSTPCLKLVKDVHNYVVEVFAAVVDSHTVGYPRLQSQLRREMQEVLNKQRKACVAFVNRKLDKERKVIFTYNDEYMKMLLANTDKTAAEGNKAVREMRVSLEAYWEVVCRRLADEIPLELRYGLREAVIEEWEEQTGVVPPQIVELMAEASHLHLKRERLEQSIRVLERCYAVLMEVAAPSRSLEQD